MEKHFVRGVQRNEIQLQTSFEYFFCRLWVSEPQNPKTPLINN